jgi:hypothetical protein
MNIKKIIQEEMDGFEWMKDANTLSNEYLRGKALEFDPFIKDQDTLDKVLKVLRSLGFSRGNWANEMEWEYDHIEGMYLADDHRIIWTGWIDENYEEHISEYIGRPVEVLNGWSVLGGSINEDFEWAKETLGRDELIQEIKDMVVNDPNYIPNGEYILLKNGIPYSPEYPLSKRASLMVKVHGYDLKVNEVWDTAVSILILDDDGEWVDNDSQRYEDLPHEFLVKLHNELKKEDTSLSLFEENFEWTADIPAGADRNKEMSWKEMVTFLKDRFEGTRFWVDVATYDDDEYPYISIQDKEDGGTYEDWYAGEVTRLGTIIDNVKYTCDNHGSEDVRLEYCELYDAIIGYKRDY